jgi:hypothetical protein
MQSGTGAMCNDTAGVFPRNLNLAQYGAKHCESLCLSMASLTLSMAYLSVKQLDLKTLRDILAHWKTFPPIVGNQASHL